MQNQKTVLVTGGAGFIGSHICDRLIAEGNKVICIDNFLLGKLENLEKVSKNPNFVFHKFDVSDAEGLFKLLQNEKIDLVFHMAANSDISQSITNPSIDLTNTFGTTVAVLEVMRKLQIRNLVFASTSAVYGDQKVNFTEDHGPLCPISHYGAAKLASEAFISSYGSSYGIKAWIARFPNVIGGRSTHGVVYDFIKKLQSDNSKLQILGDGEQNKPYIFIDDLVDALFYIWKNSNQEFNVFNIGVATRTKVKRIAEIVSQEMKLNPEFEFTGGTRGWKGDIPEFQYDMSKIHRLGWQAKHTSDQAVAMAVRANLDRPQSC